MCTVIPHFHTPAHSRTRTSAGGQLLWIFVCTPHTHSRTHSLTGTPHLQVRVHMATAAEPYASVGGELAAQLDVQRWNTSRYLSYFAGTTPGAACAPSTLTK